jgi:hypothetical protein
MPEAPVISMFKTLQQAAHHVSTAFGVSGRSYGRKRRIPLQGAGQGNGAGPAIWAAISSVLIMAMATQGHGFNILSALSGLLVSIVCYAFVDDTDIIHAAASTSVKGDARNTRSMGRTPASNRRRSCFKKSYWYAIDFKWTGSAWKYRTIADMPGNILITGVDGERVVQTRYNPDVAKETLGVMQAMDGNNKDEILHPRAKAEEFADSLQTGFLKKNDVWYALTSTILKTMEYPMAVTTMKEQEWNHILVPILKAGLLRSGIERNFPRDILFGPKCLQGFGILHPWYHQEIMHLLVCLKQTTIGGITGHQISASMEQMRLEAGLPGWFTDHNFDIWEATLTDSWIKTVWKFAHRFKLAIQDSETKLSLHCSNDCFLMEEFASAGYREQDLAHLNICRMFLHAVTISDIATINVAEITLAA